MSSRLIRAAALSLIVCMVPLARAQPAPSVQIEVDFLLGYIQESGCDFYRNGTWHAASAARSHLHDKYVFLVARDQIRTTEDFIEKAASKSSLSGETYQVRCGADAPATTELWLRAELARFRALNKKPASGLMGPRPAVPGTRSISSAAEGDERK